MPYGNVQTFGGGKKAPGTSGSGTPQTFNIKLSPGAPGYEAQQASQAQTPQTGGGFMAPGSPGSMPGTGGGLGSLPQLTNNVDPSANLKWLEDQYKSRLTADPTKRAIQGATSGIRDATSGLAKELGGNLSRRGIGQSGIRTSGEQGLAQNAQRQIAGAASAITQGRERDIDAMTMGGLPIMGAQDQLGLQKQQQGLNQWTAQNQAQYQQQQLGLQSQQLAQQGQRDLMDMWGKYLALQR